jgi:hypothetical protein
MSAINPRLKNNPKDNLISVTSPITIGADASALLQKAVQKIKPAVRSTIILRCGELPLIKATDESLEKVFTELLHMIVEKKPADLKLYLYINSSTEDTEELDLSLPLGYGRFQIQFHTNLIPSAEWMQEAEKVIIDMQTLLKPFGGFLTVNELKNPGCLFSISLPGKQ